MAITTTAPALSIGLSLPIPRLMRDYAGPVQLPQIYRATLSGSPAIAIPISSFSLRRNATSATLTLVSPYADADQIDAILARSTGALTLSRGVRFLDGTESLDVFLAAPLTSAGIRYDLGAKSGSITLTATTDDSPAPGIVRTVRGISYRSVTDGKRRIRCALDQYLVPGDVANLGGGETMTVTEMSFSVDSKAANMEIAE
jgi:hypothetical protein